MIRGATQDPADPDMQDRMRSLARFFSDDTLSQAAGRLAAVTAGAAALSEHADHLIS